TGADLTGANLTGADLTGADLTGANLTGADLTGANLTGANLTRADLTGADLTGADITGADLYGANLTRADLTGADLYGANLYGANLTGADLTGAKNIPNMARLRTQIVPDDGPFRGYKKLADGYVAILDVPESAQRSNATGRKCRVSEAVVRRIYHPDHPEADVQEGRSRHDAAFIYRVGETVRPTELFDENRWNECGSGIHLFITRAEAEAY
ncbi:MAG TPA: pentapeptide repeat-containing protein, partial [Candidatus Fermentibacter daniensis]|nr:pentapeptide repeat-containing protein [Candidatus Fermentibacter daniensis]